MEETDIQQDVNYRDQLVDRMKSRYPERNFESTDGQTSPNSLEQSILDAFGEDEAKYNELSSKQATYEENANKLTKLFNNSPRAAIFLNTLATSGDPSAAIYKAYGREAYDAFKEGDASDLIANIESEDAKRRAEDEQFEQEKAENIKASFATLDEWGNKKGLSEDQKVETFMNFYEILSDALVGKYSEALFEMGWKAAHYDEDVANARHEGEVAGRNANIQERARRRNETAAMPPALSGQGVRSEERKPAKPADNPWML